MKYFVYLIVSTQAKYKNGISYVGYTNNIKKRLLLHNNSKGAKFTRGRLWKLAYSKGYQSKNIALKEEYIKINPAFGIKNPFKSNVIPHYLTKKEIKKLIDHLSNDCTLNGLRNRAIINLLYFFVLIIY